MQFFKQVANSPTGKPSSMRLISLVTFLVVLFVWFTICMTKLEMIAIPESVVTLLGLILGGSVSQGVFVEKKPAPAPEATNGA